MDFSLFYDGLRAIHQGPGDLPSEGCIHVNPPFAERLFDWAGDHDIIVIVVKLTP
jgi:lipoprotein-anchoring transpeptidase ErfK/SrfK